MLSNDHFKNPSMLRIHLLSIFILISSCRYGEQVKIFQGQEGAREQPSNSGRVKDEQAYSPPPIAAKTAVIYPTQPTTQVVSEEIQLTPDGQELSEDTIKRVLSENSDGNYYRFPGELENCSRAPLSKTPDTRGPTADYDRLNTKKYMPNAQSCMGNGTEGRKYKSCAGLVPYCCYMMAATGDYTKCIGYWERLWCTEAQCNTAKDRGATDSQCDGECRCGATFKTDCGSSIPPVPLLKRLRDIGQIN